jgi:hypothetical protein
LPVWSEVTMPWGETSLCSLAWLFSETYKFPDAIICRRVCMHVLRKWGKQGWSASWKGSNLLIKM